MPGSRERPDTGSITPLIIGFMLVLVMLVGAVTNASAAFLKRQQLNALADSASLAATEGIEGEQVYTDGLSERARIDAAAARVAVLGQLRAAGIRGLRHQIDTRERSVTVRLRAPVDLPFHIGSLGTRVWITGTATSVITVSD